ncbi:indolepyruvate oxidoreductase subunit beta family protein [Maritalea sp.]|uniref:indolepyruvate oxidoreductase subunit beta family protein n=1 Tax=Maritalea sp. TaxID=2003361 RepID=UPI003EFA8053
MSDDKIIKLAVLAVGGQGGAVLSNWIVDVAENSGFIVQSTSVAGVAQRTGATIYYIEMAKSTGEQPVFSLSPSEDDVDILVAAELMEAGRAVMRGFVSKDKTTLICSTHRIVAVSEKTVPGDGRAPSDEVSELSRTSAKTFIGFDMERIALEAKTVISSSLFGALAGSGCLPFEQEAFENAITKSGRGVDASLNGFRAAYLKASQLREGSEITLPDEKTVEKSPVLGSAVQGPKKQIAKWKALQSRVSSFPEPTRDFAMRGLIKTIDYQDVEYGREYLDLLEKAIDVDRAEEDFALSNAAAKHLANALCYNDVVQVAELKTRSTRLKRVRGELELDEQKVLHLTEYFHPRIQEFCGMMPRPVGQFIEDRPKLAARLDKLINRGQKIRTDSLFGFTSLWVIAGARSWRRSQLRHHFEKKHWNEWFQLSLDHVQKDYLLAVEILNCRRLIKGYGDTHVRGQSKFDRVLSGLPLLKGRKDASIWITRLRNAALKDEGGKLLDGTLKTIATMSD